MDRQYLVVAVVVLAAVVAAIALGPLSSPASGPSAPDQTYPAGAGPDHINFSALESDDTNVSHTPREYWDSYGIIYTAPPERPLVEGDYYINATTGETLAERRHDATVYRNGTTYAFRQPADSIPDERQREEFENDDAFVYDESSNAYYRYDPHIGQLAPTNIGRHTDILDAYAWEAVDTATHHGVPVTTYRVTGKQTNDSRAPPVIDGTLRLGTEDGIVYTYDLTVDAGERTDTYTYEVRPAPFPEHDWVDTARTLAARNTSTDG